MYTSSALSVFGGQATTTGFVWSAETHLTTAGIWEPATQSDTFVDPNKNPSFPIWGREIRFDRSLFRKRVNDVGELAAVPLELPSPAREQIRRECPADQNDWMFCIGATTLHHLGVSRADFRAVAGESIIINRLRREMARYSVLITTSYELDMLIGLLRELWPIELMTFKPAPDLYLKFVVVEGVGVRIGPIYRKKQNGSLIECWHKEIAQSVPKRRVLASGFLRLGQDDNLSVEKGRSTYYRRAAFGRGAVSVLQEYLGHDLGLQYIEDVEGKSSSLPPKRV